MFCSLRSINDWRSLAYVFADQRIGDPKWLTQSLRNFEILLLRWYSSLLPAVKARVDSAREPFKITQNGFFHQTAEHLISSHLFESSGNLTVATVAPPGRADSHLRRMPKQALSIFSRQNAYFR